MRDAPRLAVEYVLPIRCERGDDHDDLTEYLSRLAEWADVTVVDGSDDEVFRHNAARWQRLVRHVAPEPGPGFNGKVLGVMTGLRLSRHEAVVIGDDDVRYSYSELRRVVECLGRADIVRPQNYFLERAWHTQWDTARTLVNRAFWSDYAGTLAVRRSVVLAAGGYCADALFENLELLRTVRAAGGREYRADGVFVGRTAPSREKFLAQRVRQAYDDFAQPMRLAAELALLPALVWAVARPTRLIPLVAAAVGVAEVGRRRAKGTTVFPPTSSLWAPVWLAERAVCVWLAVGARLNGGVVYRGQRMKLAATPERALRSRLDSQPVADTCAVEVPSGR
ncbi:hypothetical protein ABIE21_002441 [Conyzicola nivalis]|uniref:Nucleotide-diphospho-sugar transferase n=1 Tax=Conyzicola nivalis TaxID=1477021 RepID=A0ABV2QPE9_9MICO